MALRFFIFFFLCQWFVITGNAQSIKIRTYVGAKFYFDYVVNDRNALPGFKTNCGGNAIDAGLIFEYSTKNNWSYNFSYAHNAAGTSIAHDYRDVGIFASGCNAHYIAIWQYNFGLNYQAGKKIELFKTKNKSSANNSSNSQLYGRVSLGAGIDFQDSIEHSKGLMIDCRVELMLQATILSQLIHETLI